MVDLWRISNRKWAIVLLVFLCVSAVLFIAPWMLSVFYDSDPYEAWNEELMFKTVEKHGNTTLLCAASGPCVACTSSEKADALFKCSPTGYHKPQKCIEDRSAVSLPQNDMLNNHKGATKDPIQGKDQKSTGAEQTMLGDGSALKEGGGIQRRLLIAEDGLQTTVIYKTCIPQEVKEKLSVFGFEGVVLVCLLISAPAVHYRKKRASSTQPMQRIPSTARF